MTGSMAVAAMTTCWAGLAMTGSTFQLVSMSADGGAGADSLDFSGLTNLGVTVDLNSHVYTGFGSKLVFTSIEGVTGTDGDDVLTGNLLHPIGSSAGPETII